jgi:hypothetical protein
VGKLEVKRLSKIRQLKEKINMEHPQWIVKNGKNIVRWSDHSKIAKVEIATDAALIAAAPELLEAIRVVYSRVMNTNINTPIGEMSDTWDILRMALDGKQE